MNVITSALARLAPMLLIAAAVVGAAGRWG
jgi:hypothetical protein